MPPAAREPTSSAARRQAATLALASGAIHVGAFAMGLFTAMGVPAAAVWQSYGLYAGVSAFAVALAALFGYRALVQRELSSIWVFAPALIPALGGAALFHSRLGSLAASAGASPENVAQAFT